MQNELVDRFGSFRRGAYLPHWTVEGGIYHVVYRLADSLPAAAVKRLRQERDELQRALALGETDSLEASLRLREFFGEKIESILDQGIGACWMKDPRIAGLVAQSMQHFSGHRYDLKAACVMPNHVHAVIRPIAGHALPQILKSWKGFSGRMANRLLGRSGGFWQEEYYDHLIRGEEDLARTIQYVSENPAKAELENWPWVWGGEAWGEYPTTARANN